MKKVLSIFLLAFILLAVAVPVEAQRTFTRDHVRAKQTLTLGNRTVESFVNVYESATEPAANFEIGDIWSKTGTDSIFVRNNFDAWILLTYSGASGISEAQVNQIVEDSLAANSNGYTNTAQVAIMINDSLTLNAYLNQTQVSQIIADSLAGFEIEGFYLALQSDTQQVVYSDVSVGYYSELNETFTKSAANTIWADAGAVIPALSGYYSFGWNAEADNTSTGELWTTIHNHPTLLKGGTFTIASDVNVGDGVVAGTYEILDVFDTGAVGGTEVRVVVDLAYSSSFTSGLSVQYTINAVAKSPPNDLFVSGKVDADTLQAEHMEATASINSPSVTVSGEAYGSGWNGSDEVPTKNDVYDKIETVGGGETFSERGAETVYFEDFNYPAKGTILASDSGERMAGGFLTAEGTATLTKTGVSLDSAFSAVLLSDHTSSFNNRFDFGDYNGANWKLNSHSFEWEFRYKWSGDPTGGSESFRLGFANDINYVSGWWFMQNNNGVTKWVTDTGGTGETSIVSASPPGFAEWITVKITYDKPTQTHEFFLNGVSQGTISGIGYSGGDMAWMANYRATAASNSTGIYIDYIYLKFIND